MLEKSVAVCSISTLIGSLASAILVTLFAPSAGLAEAPQETRSLIVGVKAAPPFSIKGEDGPWSGISVDLWRDLANSLGIDYEFREFPLNQLLGALEDRSIDAGLGALTVTAERELLFDFSHPFYTTGIGVAVLERGGGGWRGLLTRLASGDFLRALGALAVVLLIAGYLVWVLERRRNPEQFGGGRAEGIGSGFWWAAVTMTTVGYGDKAPRTAGGRSVALVWMFFSVITISGFTAHIASTLTVSQLESVVRDASDLGRVRVISMPGTTSSNYLEVRRIAFTQATSPDTALRTLARGDADAVVYDAPILEYLVNAEWRGVLRVLPFTVERQDYAVAFPSGSPWREPLNRALLQAITTPRWEETLQRYLGR
jgi:ABC-type amino acid transport substrate-binding protein